MAKYTESMNRSNNSHSNSHSNSNSTTTSTRFIWVVKLCLVGLVTMEVLTHIMLFVGTIESNSTIALIKTTIDDDDNVAASINDYSEYGHLEAISEGENDKFYIDVVQTMEEEAKKAERARRRIQRRNDKKSGASRRSRSISFPSNKVPTMIILGTQKGGTDALRHYLGSHPQMIPSRRNEVHFFDRKCKSLCQTAIQNHVQSQNNREMKKSKDSGISVGKISSVEQVPDSIRELRLEYSNEWVYDTEDDDDDVDKKDVRRRDQGRNQEKLKRRKEWKERQKEKISRLQDQYQKQKSNLKLRSKSSSDYTFTPTSAATYTFEKTPFYLFHPFVPQRMKAIVPWSKIVVLLRDPVDRAYSMYKMNHGSWVKRKKRKRKREARQRNMANEAQKAREVAAMVDGRQKEEGEILEIARMEEEEDGAKRISFSRRILGEIKEKGSEDMNNNNNGRKNNIINSATNNKQKVANRDIEYHHRIDSISASNLKLDPLSFEECIDIDVEKLKTAGVVQDDTFWEVDDEERDRRWLTYWNSQDEKYWTDEEELCNGEVGRGLYVLQLYRWFKEYEYNGNDSDVAYDAEQILVMKSEKLLPDKTTQKVDINPITHFIGIEDMDIVAKGGEKIHATSSDIGPMMDETKQKLRNLFDPFNKKLGGLLGKEWDDPWPYDE